MSNLIIIIMLVLLCAETYNVKLVKIANNWYIIYSTYDYDFISNGYDKKIKKIKLTNYDTNDYNNPY